MSLTFESKPSHHTTLIVRAHCRISLQAKLEMVPNSQQCNSHTAAQDYCCWVTLLLHWETTFWVSTEPGFWRLSSHQCSISGSVQWLCWFHKSEKETVQQNGGRAAEQAWNKNRRQFSLPWIIFSCFISWVANLKRTMIPSAEADSTIWLLSRFCFFLFSSFLALWGHMAFEKLMFCKLHHL